MKNEEVQVQTFFVIYSFGMNSVNIINVSNTVSIVR